MKILAQNIRFFPLIAFFFCLTAPLCSHAENTTPAFGVMVELSGTNASNGERCKQGFETAWHLLANGPLKITPEPRLAIEDHAT